MTQTSDSLQTKCDLFQAKPKNFAISNGYCPFKKNESLDSQYFTRHKENPSLFFLSTS